MDTTRDPDTEYLFHFAAGLGELEKIWQSRMPAQSPKHQGRRIKTLKHTDKAVVKSAIASLPAIENAYLLAFKFALKHHLYHTAHGILSRFELGSEESKLATRDLFDHITHLRKTDWSLSLMSDNPHGLLMELKKLKAIESAIIRTAPHHTQEIDIVLKNYRLMGSALTPLCDRLQDVVFIFSGKYPSFKPQVILDAYKNMVFF